MADNLRIDETSEIPGGIICSLFRSDCTSSLSSFVTVCSVWSDSAKSSNTLEQGKLSSAQMQLDSSVRSDPTASTSIPIQNKLWIMASPARPPITLNSLKTPIMSFRIEPYVQRYAEDDYIESNQVQSFETESSNAFHYRLAKASEILSAVHLSNWETSDAIRIGLIMEHRFYGAPPVCFDVNPKSSSITVFGFIDGLIQYRDCRWESNILKVTRQSKLKGAIRKLKFSSDGELLYSISKNRALCVYDVETKQRVRCIRESHDDKPYSMRLLPSSSTKGQQVATGCESGEVKTWDLRVQQPLICTFSDQEEVINALETASHCLLAASSDGTLGAYELRRRRLFIQSESMNNELLSIGVINQCTYVGNGDGYLDVFKNNEYGNIVERIKCDHTLGVDCIQVLEPNVVLTASNEDQSLNLITVKPNKNVGSIGSVSGGVQQVLVDPNNNWLFVLGYMESLIKFWNLDDLRGKISDIAVDRSATDECKTLVGKRCTDSSDFFKDLCKSTLSDGDSDSNSYAD